MGYAILQISLISMVSVAIKDVQIRRKFSAIGQVLRICKATNISQGGYLFKAKHK